ncbi:anti-sigma factor [Cryobacterium zongtaii]|uniref:Anti-sigma factor n=1 Tax=Cryobacterium zongtaii TaxID=1259217 RepID=A0A2S3ZMH1_9MICO|nr:anti-sigma factor [Cryobacterium zongtaii]
MGAESGTKSPGAGPASVGGIGADAAEPAAAPTEEPAGEPAPVVQLDQQRRRRVWLPVAAAACAVGIVGGIVGGVWWQSTREPAAETVLAQAQLDALPGWTASGSAAVEESADGRREVVVDLADDAGNEGLREVWLLTADATGLVSVGLLDGATGRFSIPADLDLAEFPVVDVSAEPADGNPAHSGDSIVRGTLTGL